MVGYKIRKNNVWKVENNGETQEFKTMRDVAEYLGEDVRTCYCIYHKVYKFTKPKTIKYKNIKIRKKYGKVLKASDKIN